MTAASTPMNPAESELQLRQLETLEGYRRSFMDPGLWEPYVRDVYGRHAHTPPHTIRPGLVGTYPTFIVDDRWVIKFFGRLFDGALAFEAERHVGELLAGRSFPVPAVLASGHLFESPADWSWPYLVFEFVHGVSIGEVYDQVSRADMLALARYLGRLTRDLHGIPLPGSAFFRPSWDSYREFLRGRRARCQRDYQAWNTLPGHLIEQIEDYVLPVDELVDDDGSPHLIHVDINRDHILGRLEAGRWVTMSLIDWGDAMVGDVFYELLALHLDLFQCDKRFLRAYLETYGLEERSRRVLPDRAMSLALLHPYDVLVCVWRLFPQAGRVSTLGQLARLLWDLDSPGLSEL